MATELPYTLGVMRGLAAEVYHGIQAMSAGGLKRMAQTPAHFFGIQLDADRPPPGEPTPSMANGTLVHCALFEPDTVADRYVVRPDGMVFTTKDGKAWRDAQSKLIVDSVQMRAAKVQAANARALPEIAELLAEGEGEVSAFWIDEATGELCKCRPDWVTPAGDGAILLDGKTCVDASPEGFGRAIWNFAYHLQAAWYSDGYALASGLKVHGFVFVAVENAWPHMAAAYMLGDEVLEAARRENRQLLNLYAQCKRTNIWPGYAPGINLVELPRWAHRQLME